MADRAGLVQVSGFAMMLFVAAFPAAAKDSRTLWMCGATGCVQVVQPGVELIEAKAVVVPKVQRSVPMIQPAAAARRTVPLEHLIDMSLVTGVFQ